MEKRITIDQRTVPALGCQAEIGQLYDSHSDTFCEDTIWHPPWLGLYSLVFSPKQELIHEVNSIDILDGRSCEDPFHFLSIDHHLRLSLLSKTDAIHSQYENFLTKKFDGDETVGLLHTQKTKRIEFRAFENLSPGDKTSFLKHFNLKELQNTCATHLVWGVIYGFHTFVYFKNDGSQVKYPKAELLGNVQRLRDALLPNGRLPEKMGNYKCSIKVQGQLFPEDSCTNSLQSVLALLKSIPMKARKSEPRALELILMNVNHLKSLQVNLKPTTNPEKFANDWLPRNIAELFVDIWQSNKALKKLCKIINDNSINCMKKEDILTVNNYRNKFNSSVVSFKNELHYLVLKVRKEGSAADVSKLHRVLENFQKSEYAPQSAKIFLADRICLKDKILWYKKMKRLGVNDYKKSDFHRGHSYVFIFNEFCSSRNHERWIRNYELFLNLIRTQIRCSDTTFYMYEYQESIEIKDVTVVQHIFQEKLLSRDVLNDNNGIRIEDRLVPETKVCDVTSRWQVSDQVPLRLRQARRVPAFGRDARLGDLYDAKKDQLFEENVYYWKMLSYFEKQEIKLDHPSSIHIETPTEALYALGVDTNVQLSLLTGTLDADIWCEGISYFKLLGESAYRKIIYSYERQVDYIESNVWTALGKRLLSSRLKQSSKKTGATHFIGGIIWGCNSFVDFGYKSDDSDPAIRGYLSRKVEKFGELLQSGSLISKEEEDDDITVTVTGELYLNPLIDATEKKAMTTLFQTKNEIEKMGKDRLIPLAFLLYDLNDFCNFTTFLDTSYDKVIRRLENEFNQLDIDQLYIEINNVEYEMNSFLAKLGSERNKGTLTDKEQAEVVDFENNYRRNMKNFRDDLRKSVLSFKQGELIDYMTITPEKVIEEFLQSEWSPMGVRECLKSQEPLGEKVKWFQEMEHLGVVSMDGWATDEEFYIFYFNRYVTSRNTEVFKKNYEVFIELIKEAGTNVKFYVCEYDEDSGEFNQTLIQHHKNKRIVKGDVAGTVVQHPSPKQNQAEYKSKQITEQCQGNHPNGDTIISQARTSIRSLDAKYSVKKESKSKLSTKHIEESPQNKRQPIQKAIERLSSPGPKLSVNKETEANHETNRLAVSPSPKVNERNNSERSTVTFHTNAPIITESPTSLSENGIVLCSIPQTSEIFHTAESDEATKKWHNYVQIADQTDKDSLKPDEKYLNIILMGETGVGKSTFINAFANYLTYDSLEDAEKGGLISLIHTKFTITNENFENESIEFGQPDSNEGTESSSSTTQSCKSYVFPWKDKRVRIIDTPGINDTRGRDQDSKNMIDIVHFLSNFREIHGICFLMKPNNSRLTVGFKSGLYELFKQLHKSASDNIVFVFSNARSTFFRPGDTFPALKRFLVELSTNVDKANTIELTTDRYYCMDNEAFRFLVMLRCGKTFDERERTDFNRSWKKSASESVRLIQNISGLKPHVVVDSVVVSQVTEVIKIFSKALAEATVHLQQQRIYYQRLDGQQSTGSRTSMKRLSDSKIPKDVLPKIQAEQNLITEMRRKFHLYLDSHAASTHFDYTRQYLGDIINRERQKQNMVQDEDRAMLIQSLLEVQTNYENELSRLKSSITSKGVLPFTTLDLDQVISNLYRLEFTGNLIRKITETEYGILMENDSKVQDIVYEIVANTNSN